MNFILALDQGTTGTTVALVDFNGKIVGHLNQEHRQIFPRPGWVEHDPEEIWLNTQNLIVQLLEKLKVSGRSISSIGMTNQRETSLIWDKSGKPVYNAIVWQCRRTADFCEKLKTDHQLVRQMKKKTGLVLDPYFSGSKIRWIFKNDKNLLKRARRGELRFGTMDSFLLDRLTGGQSHRTDVSNASRTLLMNLKSLDWDDDCLKLFGVPSEILPEICPSNENFGTTLGVRGLPDGLPITGILGDQQAALFGQAGFQTGSLKCTYGTGSFILMNTGKELKFSKDGLLTTLAWQLKNQKKPTYALEGGAFICGAAVQFLRDQLGLINDSSEIEGLAKQCESSDGVTFVPSLVGLGAPYWMPDVRGAVLGLTRGTERAHIARACLEAMSLQNVDIIRSMEKTLGKKIRAVRVDGGASRNSLLLQIQSNLLGAKVLRPKVIETTVAGAAYMSGLGAGVWSSTKDLEKVWTAEKEFSPKLSLTQRRKVQSRWERAIQSVVSFGV